MGYTEKSKRDTTSMARIIKLRVNNVEAGYEEEAEEGEEDVLNGRNTSFDPPDDFWLRVGRWSLAALLFLAPIFFLPLTHAPVEIHKLLLVVVCAIPTVVSFFVLVMEKRAIAYPASFAALAVVFLLAITAASALFSVSRETSLAGELMLPDSLASLLSFAVVFFLVFYFFREADMPRLARIFLWGVSLATVVNILQLFGVFIFPWEFTHSRGFTTFGSIAHWGLGMATLLSVVAALPAFPKDRRTRALLLGSSFLSIAGLVFIHDRLLWFVLASVMVILAAMRFVTQKRLTVPLLFLFVSVFFVLVNPTIPRIPGVPIEIRPSAAVSVTVAKEVLGGLRSIAGSGPATFEIDYARFRPSAVNQTIAWSSRFFQGNNFLITALATLGILGFLAFLLVIFAFLRASIGFLEHPAAGALSGGLLFVVMSWFLFPASSVGFLWFFFGLGLQGVFARAPVPLSGTVRGFASARPAGALEDPSREFLPGVPREISFSHLSRRRSFIIFVVLLAFVAATLAASIWIGKKYVAAVWYGRAEKAAFGGDAQTAARHLERAVRFAPGSPRYLRAMSRVFIAQAVTLGAQSGRGIADPNAQSMIAAAVRAAQGAADFDPLDSQNWENLGGIYEQLTPFAAGADAFAETSYRKAGELDPHNPQIPVSIARVLLGSATQMEAARGRGADVSAKFDEAQRMLERSMALKPDYAPPHFLMVQLYMRQGAAEKVLKKVEEIRAANPFDAGLAFQLGLLYYQNSQWNDAEEEFERAVALNETYSNARYFLGLLYDRRGFPNQAIEQFERIQELNPGNAEVERILGNLRAGRSALENVSPPAPPPEERSTVPVPDLRRP